MLKKIWAGEAARVALPLATRIKLAIHYAGVAFRTPVGSAQSAFNLARAKFLLGLGKSPGKNVVAFAEREGYEIAKRGLK